MPTIGKKCYVVVWENPIYNEQHVIYLADFKDVMTYVRNHKNDYVRVFIGTEIYETDN